MRINSFKYVFVILIILGTTRGFSQVEFLSKSLLEDKIELKIPADFEIMSEKMLLSKYPKEERPQFVYTNEKGTIYVAINHTKHPASQNNIKTYQEQAIASFKSIYPQAEWIDDGVININDRKQGYVEFVAKTEDAEVYNLMFFTDLENRLLICTFSCTKKAMEEWVSVAKEIRESLKIK